MLLKHNIIRTYVLFSFLDFCFLLFFCLYFVILLLLLLWFLFLFFLLFVCLFVCLFVFFWFCTSLFHGRAKLLECHLFSKYCTNIMHFTFHAFLHLLEQWPKFDLFLLVLEATCSPFSHFIFPLQQDTCHGLHCMLYRLKKNFRKYTQECVI